MPTQPPDELTYDDSGDLRVVGADVSCENCVHAPVCTLLAGIRPMLQSWSSGASDDAQPPMEITDLAVICDEFLPEEQL